MQDIIGAKALFSSMAITKFHEHAFDGIFIKLAVLKAPAHANLIRELCTNRRNVLWSDPKHLRTVFGHVKALLKRIGDLQSQQSSDGKNAVCVRKKPPCILAVGEVHQNVGTEIGVGVNHAASPAIMRASRSDSSREAVTSSPRARKGFCNSSSCARKSLGTGFAPAFARGRAVRLITRTPAGATERRGADFLASVLVFMSESWRKSFLPASHFS